MDKRGFNSISILQIGVAFCTLFADRRESTDYYDERSPEKRDQYMPQKKNPNTSKREQVRVNPANYQSDEDRPFNRLLSQREGREERSNVRAVSPANRATPSAERKTGTQQIMDLLKEFNVRLKRDEIERERLWKEMESLQDLIESEKAKAKISEPSPKIDKWKRVMEDNQRALHTQITQTKALQSEMEGRIETVETASGSIAVRFDDVLSAQQKLTRRVDSAVEDKSRLLKKMANLEDALTQTQDTLRAKALVLLTDQATANKTDLPKTPAYEKPFVPTFGEQKPEAPIARDPMFNEQAPSTQKWSEKKSEALADPLSQIHPLKAQKQVQSKLPYYALAASVCAILAVGTVVVMQQNKTSDMQLLNIEKKLVSAPTQPKQTSFDNIDMAALAPQMNAIEPSAVNARADAQDVSVLTSVPNPSGVESAPVANTASSSVDNDIKAEQENAVQALSRQVPQGELKALIGTDATLPEVVASIEAEALKGNAAAQHDLAAIYSAGHGGVKTNFEKAARWFEQAANNGVSNARYNLGVLYHQGLGVQADEAYAIELYKTAALLGHPEAEYNLGIAYIEGIGVPQNVAKAAHYFEQAATHDVMEAAYNLGLIYENGLLGAQQPDEALFWYKVASTKGSLQGRQALESLAKQLELNPSDVDALISRIAVLKPDVKIVLGDGRSRIESAELENTQIVYTEPAIKEPVRNVAPVQVTSNAIQQKTFDHEPGGDAVIVAQIQDQLIDLGLYPGPADGITGPLTQDAVRVYQEKNGLSTDGEASEDLLVHMLAREFELNTYPASGLFEDVGSQE